MLELLSLIWSIIVIVFFLMLLFAVRDIREQASAANLRLRTLNTIMRKLHPAELPPKDCPSCKNRIDFGQNNCAKCKTAIEW
jgi:hypothetical protein